MTVRPQPDVPILIETPGRSFFQMVRCHYMSVECDDPRPGWGLQVDGLSMPFLMLNLVGIVYQPLGAARFDSFGLIDQFFERIEEQASLSLNFEDIWLPSFLFQAQPAVGDVYRVGNDLFVLAYQFRDGRHTQEDFEAHCRKLQREIVLSEDETRAFKGWTAEQVSSARNRPPKNPNFQLQTKKPG
jgi:hypothetical protein